MRERDRERYLQLLEGILDNLPIAAKVKDVNDGMRYTFWNKKAEELFECSAREAIGKTDFETMPEAAALIRKEDQDGDSTRRYTTFFYQEERGAVYLPEQ